MRLMRPACRWVVLVFASAALGAACSNSDHGPDLESTTPYPPAYCPCTKGLDGAVSILDGGPDGCILDDGGGLCIVILPPPPSEGGM
jgi:hypothetical protein